MLLRYNKVFEIESLEDVKKFGEIMKENNIDKSEINISEIARNVGVSRDTINRYLDGFQKIEKREKSSKVDKFKTEIDQLLKSKNKEFNSKQAIYEYLKREHPGEIDFAANTFRHYMNTRYTNEFEKHKNNVTTRFETKPGQQAQFDFKEDFIVKTITGETIKVQIAVLQLGYSRFVFRKIIPDKSTNSVIQFMIECFKSLGYVPKQMVVDNAKCLVDKPRSRRSNAIINSKFEQFAKDFNFEIYPCMPYRACTKGKVEKTMKKVDDIRIYNGDIKDLLDLNIIINTLTKEFNYQQNSATNFPPELLLKQDIKEMNTLPNTTIINTYTTKFDRPIKVDKTGMIKHYNKYYSVPYVLINKKVTRQQVDEKLYIFYDGIIVASHQVTGNLINKFSYHDPTHKSKSKFINNELDNIFINEENEIALQALKNMQKLGKL